MVLRISVILAFWLGPVMAGADQTVYTPADLDALSFLYGREYFVLRSGRIQMVVQADRMDLGTSFGYLLFDAQDARQTARKANAFNFDSGTGLSSSTLSVELGGYAFSAVGDRTVTQWVLRNGIPTVQATWWAGGVRVTEQLRSLASGGVFSRLIRLEGAHLAGDEQVSLILSLPPGPCRQSGSLLAAHRKGAVIAVAATGDRWPVEGDEARSSLRIGPIPVAPGQTHELETLLLAQVPPGGEQDLLASVAGAAQAEQAARNAWTAVSRVETADRTISGIFDKARFGLPGMIADDGTIDAGIFEYGAQWVRDTSNTVVGAVHAGEFEIAKAALQRMLTNLITAEGVTMIGNSFDEPDREQFDQMGELLHALKCYRDWTGDDSLIREHRERLLVAIERPLRPQFRDDTGMVHNKREFWERVLSDAYELAYQTYVIRGLLDAADLAPALGAEDRAELWRKEAARTHEAMLSHPSRALVDRGRLIKRRNITGEIADISDFPGFQPDTPARTERVRRLMPDASQALPIALGVVDARSDLARRTLEDLDGLWNARWSDGGHDRYHTSSQPDQPGPWPFATCFILRAQHDAGLYEASRRSLEWLNTVQGGHAGTWFEEIPSIRSTRNACGCGLLPWTSGEIALFVVRHYLGVRFEGESMVIHPALYPGSPPVKADLRYRNSRLQLEITGSGPITRAEMDGKTVAPDKDGTLHVPTGYMGGRIMIQCETDRSSTTKSSTR